MQPLNESGWFGQLQISGTSKTVQAEGSILDIMRQLMTAMSQSSPRELANGKQLTLILRTSSFDGKLSIEAVEDVAAGIESELEPDGAAIKPFPDESFAGFYDRLIASGVNLVAAQMIACDWFDKPVDERIKDWLSDPRAARFRQLNSDSKAYEAALPSEYVQLKQYVLQNFSSFVEGFTFRTA